MIASVIGLVVLSGAVTVFTSNKKSQELSSGMARIQESGRAALDILSNDIRLAGYQGCTDGAISPVVIATNTPTITFPTGSLWGAEIGNSSWTPSRHPDLTNAGSDPLPGSDVVYVQHASGRTTILASSMASASDSSINLARNPDQIVAGDLMMISNCHGADIFRSTAVSQPTTSGVAVTFGTQANTQANLSRAYTVSGDATTTPMRVMRFESNAYFVGESGRTDASGNSIKSLFVLDTSTDPIDNPTELIEGVEMLQVLYGEQQLNGSVRYLPADDTSLNIEQVVSVQIGLLVGSIDQVTTGKDNRTYLVGNQEVGPIGSSAPLKHATDRQLRAAFNSTIRLRNRSPNIGS
ncbi:hypothetical protein AB833_27415 [Chromatiales bacterium (ex Bugula neritina AB1)]|nr:hypothetical protein AB833_27415 [Chromatiales bacterium (ex Bugula neritina AB1)]